jgi:hypothetical protein
MKKIFPSVDKKCHKASIPRWPEIFRGAGT